MKPEREKRLLGNRGKEKQLILKQDNNSSNRLLMIESELPICKIMFNVHVQCIIACHITCVLSLPLPPSLPPSLSLSLALLGLDKSKVLPRYKM